MVSFQRSGQAAATSGSGGDHVATGSGVDVGARLALCDLATDFFLAARSDPAGSHRDPVRLTCDCGIGVAGRRSANVGWHGGRGPSVGSSLLALPALVLRYLQNIAFPSTLSLAYPEIANGELGPRFFVGLVVLPIILAGVFQLSRGNRRRQFLALASLIPFIPVLYAGALQQSDLVQDRYIYLPLALGVLWLADVAAAGWSRGGKWRTAVGVAGLGWSLLLVISFRPNLLIWSGQLPLYRRAVEVAPENPKYLMNLSNALRRSDPAADENCELLSRARDMRAQGRPGTDDVTLSFNAGNCHRMQGRPQLAIELYEAAFRLSEGELYPARRNIVSALIDLNRLDEALRITESLTDDFPESGWSWNLNGVVLARMARWPEAERSFRRVLRLTPDDRQAEIMLLASRTRWAGCFATLIRPECSSAGTTNRWPS